jgi:histidinol-phosphatase (PHP family)
MPTDSHVHSEWSWDAEAGSMERTCARAVALGVPAVAFTEHADWTVMLADEAVLAEYPALLGLVEDGGITPPALDVDGYLAEVERCRDRYPGLRILTGVELGEPHLRRDEVASLLGRGAFERALGSLHCLPHRGGFAEPGLLYADQVPAAEVVRVYLAEIPRLVEGNPAFEVLAHIDYPLRAWPVEAGVLDIDVFAEPMHDALAAAAAAGVALEINTSRRLEPQIVSWWHDLGGPAVTFGSDAHEPLEVARDLQDAAALAEACGYRPGPSVLDPWSR